MSTADPIASAGASLRGGPRACESVTLLPARTIPCGPSYLGIHRPQVSDITDVFHGVTGESAETHAERSGGLFDARFQRIVE